MLVLVNDSVHVEEIFVWNSGAFCVLKHFMTFNCCGGVGHLTNDNIFSINILNVNKYNTDSLLIILMTVTHLLARRMR